MKNKITTIYLLAAAALVPAGCNDDFMDRQPQTEIGTGRFFNTEEDLKMYCLGLYDFPSSWNYVSDGGTDNQATTSNVEVKNIMGSANPSSATITSGWDWDRLRDINIFLDNCEKADVPPDILAHYQGIARFFRAKFYMGMVQRYSDVPWYEKPLPANDPDLYKGRDPREFVVQKIFEDYDFAGKNVKTGRAEGEVDKWVVLTYMARHALYEGTFRKYHDELNLESTAGTYLKMARDAANEIMTDGGFDIYNTGNPEKDYGTLFESTDLSGNPEIILATYYDQKLISGGFWAYMFGNYEACPAKDLLQSYLMRDGSFYTSQENYQAKSFVEEFENRDLRLKQTYAYPGWELINTSTYAPGAGIYVQSFNKNFTGYHQLKGFVNDRLEEVYNSIDFPVLRYAEVLLTYAEARAELGELTGQDLTNTINKLRKRAGVTDMTLNVNEDPVMKTNFPNVSSPVILEIRRERRVELALEGLRPADLMRWKAGKLLEKIPEGIYFPSLGKFDLTGDGVEDIYLIPSSESIPAEADKESNSLGKKLVYYKTGPIDDSNATVYLKNGTGGNIITAKDMGTFEEPKYYYRPVPRQQVVLNPDLAPQLFGWE
jgi:hypothetical protein